MKRIKLILVMLLVISGIFTMQSCKKDTLVPFTEKASFTIPALVAPASGGFLSLATTTVDLKWESTNADGATLNYDVYFGTSDDPARVQTAYTQTTLTVNVLKGYKYYWRVNATDPNGVVARGPLWSFEVVDPTAPLNMKMTWTTDAKSVVNLDLAPEKAVDLRLLILKSDKVTTATSIINTGGFEEYGKFNTLVDGTYYIATDIASTVNFNSGSANVPFDISINLQFLQRGTVLDPGINSYAKNIVLTNVMTNKFNCSSYKTVLAKVVKAGSTYTIDKSVSFIVPAPPAKLAGTWHGSDFGYTSTVTTAITGGKLLIDGVGTGWMNDPVDGWGEVPTATYPAEVVVNLCAGTVTIANQKFMQTTWKGDPQTPYYIQGTGTFDLSGAYPVLVLNYDFIQGGTSIAKYFGVTTFKATLTLDPAAAKSLLDNSGITKGLLVRPAKK
jgi:hypothetical protein